MNKLAEALRMDPVEIRTRNLLIEGALLSVGTPLPKGVSITQVVEHCAKSGGWQKTALGWQRRKDLTQPYQDLYLKRGVGFACAFKNVGFSFGAPENCWATVELHGTGEIETRRRSPCSGRGRAGRAHRHRPGGC